MSQVGYTGLIIPGNINEIINTEAASMAPFHDYGYKGVINQSLFFKHSQHVGTKQFGQGLNADLGHDIKNTASAKQTISNNGVDVWVPFCVVTECLDSHHCTNDTVLQTKSGLEKNKKAVCGTFTEFGKQLTVVEKRLAQDDWNAENILAMRQRVKNVLP